MRLFGLIERRKHPRSRAAIPVRVETPERRRVAMSKDYSRSGTLLLTDSKFELGQQVELVLSVSPAPSACLRVGAEVVRVEPCGESFEWRYALGVRFDRLLPEGFQVPAELLG